MWKCQNGKGFITKSACASCKGARVSFARCGSMEHRQLHHLMGLNFHQLGKVSVKSFRRHESVKHYFEKHASFSSMLPAAG
jgi:hypothetical protein